MTPNITPSSPTRRFYRTGETLPELETTFRPIPLGRDSQGEPDGQIRAFAVSIRNRAETPVYVKEGVEGDAARVDRYESFDIYEPNGVSQVLLKGDVGGEEVEIRTVEGHNDFDVADKIDGFIRSISHFLSQNKQETTITGAETVIETDIQDSQVTFDTAIDSVANGVTFPTQIQGSDVSLATTIESVDGAVNLDTTITGSDVDIPVTGDVGVSGTVDVGTLNTFSDTVTLADVDGNKLAFTADGNLVIDDITATSANFDGDITGQTNFDLTATTRKGQTTVDAYDANNQSVGYFNSNLSQIVAEYAHVTPRVNADYDGELNRVEFRVFDTSAPEAIGFTVEIDYGSTGSWERVSPRATMRGEFARKFNGNTVFTPRFYPNGDVVIVWEPADPVTFEAGDSLGVEIGPHGTSAGDGSADYELEVQITDIVTR